MTDFLRQRQWPSTPENAGHRRDFYRLADPAPDPVVVERFFANIEDATAPVLRKLTTDRRPPNSDELEIVLLFMAFQFVRVPAFRPFVLSVFERIARDRVAEALKSPTTWRAALTEAGINAETPGANYERAVRFHESGAYDLTAETDWYLQKAFEIVERVHAQLLRRHWGTLISPAGRFVGSDNPVVMDGDRGRMVGFGNADLVIYPASRHISLAGTLDRVVQPPNNFNTFASLNTFMMIRSEAQVFSHIPNFPWLDESRAAQTDWRFFAKDKY